jgi:murein L,D-transpeptidase YcbB/YkuD
MRWKTCLGIVLCLMGAASAAVGVADSEPAEIIREKVENLESPEGAQILGETVAAGDRLARFYERRFFQPAWGDPARVRSMIAAIRSAEAHGLVPDHYHMESLQRLSRLDFPATPAGGHREADLDILLTDSFLQLAHDLSSGRVNPARINPDWNFSSDKSAVDLSALLAEALADGRIQARLEALAPRHPLYRRMKTALARYRRIAAAGGWPSIPEGPLLKVGLRDARVPLLRERLMQSGDLGIDTDGDPLVFEPPLARAVLRFQERTRVDRDDSLVDDEDGAVGETTRSALNVPVEKRIRQLRVNLERCRWLFHDQPASFVLVDMAGFRGYFYKNDEIVWRARVQVGDAESETPSFRAVIKYVVFNPTWTVPPGILRRTTLPRIRKDPTYLSKRDLQVFDRAGKLVDPATVDWAQYTASSLPYRIVQKPGPNNAVGRVKFIFPNRHFVYLHDTPHKSEFGLNDRAFSAGCIRIDKPYKLAKRLLDSEADPWTIGRIQEILSSNQTRTVFLPEPMPVLLVYLTVQVDDRGQVFFRKDIYQRDKVVFKNLEADAVAVSASGWDQSSG